MSATLAGWLPWIQALGWTLVHFLWQGLVVGLAYGAVRALLPKTHCHARYAAGIAALALLTLWPLATLIALRPESLGADVVGGVMTDVAALHAVAAGGYDLATLVGSLLPWLVSLWMVGVFAGGWRALRQWHQLAQLARRWAVASPELETMVAALSQRFGFMRKVRVLVSPRVDTPMLIGWLKPVVLLPTAVALGFPRHQLELILAHELGHLRRYDHLVNLAQALLETLLFYHPVVHWISREVRNERELCCDALVLGLTRGEPREYAQTLAALEELRQVPAAFALAASGGELLERVRRIIGMPAPRLAGGTQGQMRWLFAVALLGAGLILALRVGREDAGSYTVSALSINWLQLPSSATLPLATVTLPFERPRLQLAQPGTPEAASDDTRAGQARPAMPALAGRTAVDSRSQPSPSVAPALASAAVAVAGPDLPSTRPLSPDAGTAPIAPTTAPARVGTAPAPATAAPVAATRPVATRIVQPRFPSFAQRAAGRIEASFAIAADGSVTDIQLVEGAAGSAFARAAERALKQWRFDPASLTPGDRARYTQTFVFAPSKGTGGRDECFKPTGSLVCRDPEDTSAATIYEVRH